MPKWQPFTDGPKTYDLSHLEDRVLTARVGDRDVGILVEFTDHCFTVAPIGADPRPIFPDCSRKDGRFCEIRYDASLRLWGHLERVVNNRVWHGEQDRSLLVAIEIDDGGKRRFYVVPFTLERVTGIKEITLRMRVRTGFIKDENRHIATFGEVRFINLISLAVQGKKPPRMFGEKRKRPW